MLRGVIIGSFACFELLSMIPFNISTVTRNRGLFHILYHSTNYGYYIPVIRTRSISFVPPAQFNSMMCLLYYIIEALHGLLQGYRYCCSLYTVCKFKATCY